MTSIDLLTKKNVYFYSPGQILPFGSGSAIRQYTNLRAYLDLGFKVEVIQFIDHEAGEDFPIDGSLEVANWYQVRFKKPQVDLFHRLAFTLGFPRSLVLDILFPVRTAVIHDLNERLQRDPHGIYHFEYIDMASAVVDNPYVNSIWSCHDIFSQRIPMLWGMRKTPAIIGSDRYHRLRLDRLRKSEDWVAKSQKLILNIAIHGNWEFCVNRHYEQAEFFPMSWIEPGTLALSREWLQGGRLHLLHLGSIDGFIGYDSLSFILGKVFPLLPDSQLNRIELLVAGKIGDSHYSREIMKLKEKFPQVKLLGYVENIQELYEHADLQLVGATRATGLRTRIIESFVYGVPVLSTYEGAKGVAHVTPGKDILIADDAPSFAAAIVEMLEYPQKLSGLAVNAQYTYQQNYSREVARESLKELLERYL